MKLAGLLRGLADRYRPEWLNPRAYVRARAEILEDPSQVKNRNSPNPELFAIFCLFAPYFFLLGVLNFTTWAEAIPEPSSHVLLEEAKKSQIELNYSVSTVCNESLNRGECVQRANAQLRRFGGPDQEAIENYVRLLQISDKLESAMLTIVLGLIPISIFINSYIISVFWERAFPVSLSVSSDRRAQIQKSYLYVSGASQFNYAIWGSLIIFGVLSFGRYYPEAIGAWSQFIYFVGALPLFVNGVIVSQRLNGILNNDASWRYGKAIRITILSNILTNLILCIALFVILKLWQDIT